MADGDVVQLVGKGRLFGLNVFNVFHFRDMGGGGTTFADLASQFEDLGYGNPTVANFTDDFTIPEFTVQRIAPTVGPLLSFPGTFAGSSAADSTPQLAVVTTWLTDTGGRSGRGRTYWGGIGEDSFTSGLLISSVKTTFDQRAQSILDTWGPSGLNADDYRLVVWSRLQNLSHLVTNFRTHARGRTQRRRAG